MTLNLTQLYELRNNVALNPNRVVSKNAFLKLLDSHISLFNSRNDLQLVRDTKEPDNGLQKVYEHYALTRHPPVTIERRDKAYRHHI